MNILALSGSLKSTSTNTYILRAMEGLFPDHVSFSVFENLAMMPHFNPEDDSGNDAVHDFRKQLKRADAVIISTPEYAFGVPGVLKNALDWIVSSGELNEKGLQVEPPKPDEWRALQVWPMDAQGRPLSHPAPGDPRLTVEATDPATLDFNAPLDLEKIGAASKTK